MLLFAVLGAAAVIASERRSNAVMALAIASGACGAFAFATDWILRIARRVR